MVLKPIIAGDVPMMFRRGQTGVRALGGLDYLAPRKTSTRQVGGVRR